MRTPAHGSRDLEERSRPSKATTDPKHSNEVEVEVPANEGFTVKKEQQLSATSGSYTTAKLTGKVGETVDYLITSRTRARSL